MDGRVDDAIGERGLSILILIGAKKSRGMLYLLYCEKQADVHVWMCERRLCEAC